MKIRQLWRKKSNLLKNIVVKSTYIYFWLAVDQSKVRIWKGTITTKKWTLTQKRSVNPTPCKNRLLNGIVNSCGIYERASVLFNPFFVWKGLKFPSIFKIKEFHLYWNEQTAVVLYDKTFFFQKENGFWFHLFNNYWHLGIPFQHNNLFGFGPIISKDDQMLQTTHFVALCQ